jgi:hypothetical protein
MLHMKKSDDPDRRSLLDLLLGDVPAPAGFDADEFTRARALAQSIESAVAWDVESLPEPLALAVLEASVRARDPKLADELSSSARKAVAKAAKKSLYQLRSLGVSLPERAEVPSAPLPAAPAEELPSLLSSVSGAGEQGLIVPRTLRGGGLELLQIIVSDEKGISQLVAYEVGRSAYRKQLREIKAGRAAPAVEIERDEARQILSGAAALNLASGSPYPDGADEALRHLAVTPHAESVAIPAPEAGDERLANQSGQLHSEPEVQPWLPPEPEIRLLAEKMEQVTHSPLELTEAQRSEQVINLFRSAARDFFTPTMRKMYAGRLWRMASFFERTGRQRQAEIARAEAGRLFHGSGEPFSRFAELLFEKVLWLSQRDRPGQGPQVGAPPVKETENPGERRSPGGLILP